ncbi:MAG: hypothetical protein ACYDAC_05885 [Candidatus Dormibacteria bacterium]
MTRINGKPNMRRRLAIAGGTAVLAAAGVGGYVAMGGGGTTLHVTPAAAQVGQAPTVDQNPAAEAPELSTPAETGPDTGPNVEQNGDFQSGAQSGPQDTTGPDTTAGAPEAGN